MEICFESDCKGVIPFRDYGTFCILPPSDRLSEVSMDAVTLLLSTALWKAVNSLVKLDFANSFAMI